MTRCHWNLTVRIANNCTPSDLTEATLCSAVVQPAHNENVELTAEETNTATRQSLGLENNPVDMGNNCSAAAGIKGSGTAAVDSSVGRTLAGRTLETYTPRHSTLARTAYTLAGDNSPRHTVNR